MEKMMERDNDRNNKIKEQGDKERRRERVDGGGREVKNNNIIGNREKSEKAEKQRGKYISGIKTN
jgi:hypothetical protein